MSSPVEFEDLGEGDKPVRKKKEHVGLYLNPLADETLADVPELKMLYSNFLSRKWLSAIVSPGGSGKSALGVAEAVAMASGIDFLGPRREAEFDDLDSDDVLGFETYKRFPALRVGLFNFEDDNDTMRRRFAAVRQHHGISFDQVAGRLFFSGAEQQARFSFTDKGDLRFDERTISELRAIVLELKLDVLLLDPFVSMHFGDENLNSQMAEVWGRLRALANELNIAIQIAHHTRKGSAGVDLNADDARGGSAIKGVVRFLRVVNRMQPEVAKKLDMEADSWRYIRIDDGKANHVALSSSANWRRLASVSNEAHEHSVVAVEHWDFPTEAPEDAESVEEPLDKMRGGINLDAAHEAVLSFYKDTGRSVFGKVQLNDILDSIPGLHDRRRRSDVRAAMLKFDVLHLEKGLFTICNFKSPKTWTEGES